MDEFNIGDLICCYCPEDETTEVGIVAGVARIDHLGIYDYSDIRLLHNFEYPWHTDSDNIIKIDSFLLNVLYGNGES